ncbi:MAG: hypothetical protein QM728_11940 [Gordonia sp. (in: high G+C Gram-positive bacteria)]|uniref:hypothetical protein n=1 Tax=Gordonia sp. (in: high G+C Gram-positive bacteria) TaxID=84139 RepID=UPI0039E35C4D
MKATKHNDGGRGTNRAARRKNMKLRGAVAGVAVASSLALGGALVAPPAPAHAASNGYLGGVALDPQGVVEKFPLGDVIWPGIKGLFGDSNSTAILPLSFAVSAAPKGQSATAFAMIGLAMATGDLDIASILKAPGQLVCLGGLTIATSSNDGACANALGVLSGDYNPNDKSVSVGLINPLGVIEVISDPTGTLLDMLKNVGDGDSRTIQKLLTKDFARLGLSVGGRTGSYGLPNLVAVTSDYFFQKPITIDWLGQKVTIFPQPTLTGTTKAATTPNYVALPNVQLSSLDTSKFLPAISGLSLSNFKIPGADILDLLGDLGQVAGGGSPLGKTAAAPQTFSLNVDDQQSTGELVQSTLTASRIAGDSRATTDPQVLPNGSAPTGSGSPTPATASVPSNTTGANVNGTNGTGSATGGESGTGAGSVPSGSPGGLNVTPDAGSQSGAGGAADSGSPSGNPGGMNVTPDSGAQGSGGAATNPGVGAPNPATGGTTTPDTGGGAPDSAAGTSAPSGTAGPTG